MTVLHFLHLLFNMSHFMKYFGKHQEKKLHVRNRLNFYSYGSVEELSLREKMFNFCVANITISFRKLIVKEGVKQTI